MHTPALVLFDFDGTLVDSAEAILVAARSAFETLSLTPPTEARVHGIIGLSLDEAMAELLPEDLRHLASKVADAYRVEYRQNRELGRYPSLLFDGIGEVLDRLGKNNLRLGIATGKSKVGVEASLAELQLRDRFCTVQTSDGGAGKPAPDMVLRALAETGVAAECTVVVGDTDFDVQMANNAGVASIAVTWGYHAREQLENASPSAIIDRVAELPATIDRLLR